jgi:SulP family sulfate permease
MKVIGAYAVTMAISPSQIAAAGVLMAILLLIIGLTGAITVIGKYTPKSVIRGVQLSTGALLMAEGVRLVLGTSKFQQLHGAAEPYLSLQYLGPVPLGIVIGLVGGALTFLLLDNKRLPSGLLIVSGGIGIGLLLGINDHLDRLPLGVNIPTLMPFGMPTTPEFTFALFALVAPQTPMTIGNAVIAYADLSRDYFGNHSKKVTYRGACLSMAMANFISFLLGGMPLCHGAGGLAAHYRFGARTAGSNLMIGSLFVALAIFLGDNALALVELLPMSVLGVLLLFAGSQLALSVLDVRERKDLFVALLILGITLATNLAIGFAVGLGAAYALKSDKLTV